MLTLISDTLVDRFYHSSRQSFLDQLIAIVFIAATRLSTDWRIHHLDRETSTFNNEYWRAGEVLTKALNINSCRRDDDA